MNIIPLDFAALLELEALIAEKDAASGCEEWNLADASVRAATWNADTPYYSAKVRGL